MEEELEEPQKGGSIVRKLIGVLAIFGTVFAALFWWRRRGAGADEMDGESDV
jgi:hypothetical protein